MDANYAYLNEENYNKKIERDARVCFGFDLDYIRHYIKYDMNGVVTRDWVWNKIREWTVYDETIKHKSKGFKKLIEKLLKKEEIKCPYPLRNIIRLMRGLMDLMDLDELTTEYIEEFQRMEDEFYEPFRGVYEGLSRKSYPYSKYLDNDFYVSY